MKYYDYEQVPLSVADAAFADFMQNWQQKSILDLPSALIQHCDQWCEEQSAFSEQDHRVAVIMRLQAYLHEKYNTELMQLMRAKISKFQQAQLIKERLHERRN